MSAFYMVNKFNLESFTNGQREFAQESLFEPPL
jgi:hypothetical protein